MNEDRGQEGRKVGKKGPRSKKGRNKNRNKRRFE